jgi:hypothetical protein
VSERPEAARLWNRCLKSGARGGDEGGYAIGDIAFNAGQTLISVFTPRLSGTVTLARHISWFIGTFSAALLSGALHFLAFKPTLK